MYPLVMTGIAQLALFKARRTAASVTVNGGTTGSELIGQRFCRTRVFSRQAIGK